MVVYASYLRKMIVPNDLAIFYPHPRDHLALTAVAVAAAVLLSITLAAVLWFRRFPYLFVGWCWYLGTLIPTIGIVQVGRQQMADRFTYFPSIGLFIAFVWLARGSRSGRFRPPSSLARNRRRLSCRDGRDLFRAGWILAK